MHRMTLELDDDDYRDITAELDRRREHDLPDGKSNTVGAPWPNFLKDDHDGKDINRMD